MNKIDVGETLQAIQVRLQASSSFEEFKATSVSKYLIMAFDFPNPPTAEPVTNPDNGITYQYDAKLRSKLMDF